MSRKITLGTAKKLMVLMQGETLTASSLPRRIREELLQERILTTNGKIQKRLYLPDQQVLANYLYNRYGIRDLAQYIEVTNKPKVSRAELTAATSNSKHRQIRTFKGFLINSYKSIPATYKGQPAELTFEEGLFRFLYDFEDFVPASDVVIVGVENAETFRYIGQYKYLFEGVKPLFVSRYPQNQSKDLITWLMQIPNHYIHFGDFDPAGINIYLNEFKKHLSGKATFLIPDNIDTLIKIYGNRERYDNQTLHTQIEDLSEESLQKLAATIHRLQKGLDQERLAKG